MPTREANKYTVHQRLSNAETRCAQLEAGIKRVKLELLDELTKYAEAHFHGRNGVDGRDGNDCVCRSVPGEKGAPGSVLFIGAPEVEAAVAAVRAELLRFRAKVLGRIIQGIDDNKGKRGHSTLVHMHFAKLMSDIENDIAAQDAKSAS